MRKLYRPVGLKELYLILDTECSRYPERLPAQPIFYPVLHQKYAIEIAEKWNTRDENSGFSGFVTEFEMDEEYLSKYEPHIVGAAWHEELWVPADELAEFNSNIAVPIKISHAFYGEKYREKGMNMQNKDYIDQFIRWNHLRTSNSEEFSYMVLKNWKAVTANYIAWLKHENLQEMCLQEKTGEAEKKAALEEIRNILIQNGKWFFTF